MMLIMIALFIFLTILIGFTACLNSNNKYLEKLKEEEQKEEEQRRSRK